MKIFTALLMAAAALGQTGTPNIVNSRFETRTFSGDFMALVKSSAPAWFGYPIRTNRGNHNSCCWNDYGHGCWLEENRKESVVSTRPAQPIALEGTDTIALLFRVENNQVTKIRVFSLDCPLDGGGLPFVWMTSVPATQSVAFLKQLARQDGPHELTNGAIFALSVHDDAIALDALIQLAKTDPSPHLREQALFWLAQKAGARASATIENAIVNDPDTNVKKHAVFALSQLPKDEGVPKLIDVARTQRNPEVRKQAFFWLGQSKDPRALAFLEEVLTK